jgi:hypothetical protein
MDLYITQIFTGSSRNYSPIFTSVCSFCISYNLDAFHYLRTKSYISFCYLLNDKEEIKF